MNVDNYSLMDEEDEEEDSSLDSDFDAERWWAGDVKNDDVREYEKFLWLFFEEVPLRGKLLKECVRD